MSSSNLYNRGRQRSGFTLTELLIGITIIGLLVGMLAVVGSGAINRSREFAVSTEIVQMSQAIENFKTKYGFYPPSFEQFKRQANTSGGIALAPAEANQLISFLNKISPNHRELDPSPTGSGLRRIDDWWLAVGVNLNQQTSLQFWLSGLCHNKQFPLTGGFSSGTRDGYVPKGFSVNEFAGGAEIVGGLEREVFYEFDQDRLFPIVDIAGTMNLPVAQYDMAHGKQSGALFYLYRDSASYLPFVQPGLPGSGTGGTGARGLNKDFTYSSSTVPSIADLQAYLALDYSSGPGHSGAAYHFKRINPDASLNLLFGDQDRFQLISAGIDGDAGVSTASVDRGDVQLQLPKAADNLCNFADGRLDKFVNDNL